MNLYRIIQTTSGMALGCYKGANEDEAIRAMLADAGAPDADPDPGLVAELEEEYEAPSLSDVELLSRRQRTDRD